MTWEEEGQEEEHGGHESGEESAEEEHGGGMQGDAMNAYAHAGSHHHGAWHAECSSPCLRHGTPTDHGHALAEGGQHLSSAHEGLSEGIVIRDDQHGHYHWECQVPCGYVGPTRGSEQEANDDAEEHREQRPQHGYYVSVAEGPANDES